MQLQHLPVVTELHGCGEKRAAHVLLQRAQGLGNLAVLIVGASSGMNHVMAFVIVFYVADIGGEEPGAAVFSVLPDLLDRHILRINPVTHASGIIILRRAVVLLYLGSPVVVVKAHDVAVRGDQARVLLILPLEVGSYRLEEIAVHPLLRPSFRIGQDPVKLSGLKIDVDDGIHMSSGKCQAVALLIVPHRVVVEPVLLRPAAALSQSGLQEILIIPGL